MDQNSKPGVVLYAEDEENDALFMQMAFRKAGCGHLLHVVKNGQEAVDYLSGNGIYADRASHPLPSVLLLDLNLPVLSGFGVLGWLRNHLEFHSLPVVVFSSSTRPEDKLQAVNLGAAGLFKNPPPGKNSRTSPKTCWENPRPTDKSLAYSERPARGHSARRHPLSATNWPILVSSVAKDV